MKPNAFWTFKTFKPWQRTAIGAGALACILLFAYGAASAWHAISVSILTGKLRDPKPSVRREAIRNVDLQLSKCGWHAGPYCQSRRVVEAMIAALKDPDPEVRVSAASALGSTKNLSAVVPLIAALAETDYEIRVAAPTVGDADVVVDGSNDPDSGARREAAEALGEIGDLRAVEPLIAALKDTNVSVREAAAEALGVLKDPRAIGPLIDVLRNRRDFSRGQAAASLVNFKDPRVVDALIASLGDDWVHGSAAQTLDEIKGDPGVAWPLIVALNDPNPKIRGAVADLLGRIKDPRASKPLSDALLKDPDEDVRLNVVKALIRRGEPGSEKALIAALDYRPNIDIANELLNCGNPILHDAVTMRYETTFAGPPRGSSTWGATR